MTLEKRFWFKRAAAPALLVSSASPAEIRHEYEQRLNAGWLLATVVFILALILYVATMCRTVFWWDAGELTANIKVLGIAHRPGFPLYILLGRLFSLAPFGDYFYRINFVSALTAAVALAVLAYVWFEAATSFLRPRRPWEGTISVALPLVAIAGMYTLWIQAARAEVYAPTLLAVALLWGTAWGAHRAVRGGRADAGRWLCLAAFLSGLGLGLHSATFASVLPSLALFFLVLGKRHPFGRGSWAAAVLLFLIGLSVYLYLPVRAAQNPLLNWGWTTADRSPGWGAVVGSDAMSEVLQTSIALWAKRLWLSWQLLFDQFQWGLALLATWGLIIWWRRSRPWTLLALGTLLGNAAVTATLVTEFNDTNADIHGYLLPGLAAIAFLVVGGVVGLVDVLAGLPKRLPTAWLRRLLTTAVGATLALLAIAPLVIYAPYCNLVSHRLAYDYATEATAGLRPGAVVFLANTNLDFVLRGLQYCDGWRTDICFLNRDLLPAGWYRQWVFDRYPELAAYPIPSDSARLHLGQWAANLAEAGFPVYWEFTETSMNVLQNLTPAGHLFAFSPDPVPFLESRQIRAQEEFERQSRFYGSPRRILYDYDAQRVYVASLYRAGMYYESRGLYDRARELFQRALSVFAGDLAARRRRAATRSLGRIDSLAAPLSGVGQLDSAAAPQ